MMLSASDTLVNETILLIKNEAFGAYGKPNAVVKPMQRSEQPLSDISSSANNKSKPIDSDKVDQKQQKISILIKDAENQLKTLQSDKQKSSKNGSDSSLNNGTQNRPRFVCTVPCGVFLDPPKEFTYTFGRGKRSTGSQQTYAYFSAPKLYAQGVMAASESNLDKSYRRETTNAKHELIDEAVHIMSKEQSARTSVSNELEAKRRKELRQRYIFRKNRPSERYSALTKDKISQTELEWRDGLATNGILSRLDDFSDHFVDVLIPEIVDGALKELMYEEELAELRKLKENYFFNRMH